MSPELVAQIVGAFQPDAGVRIDKLDAQGEAYQRAKRVEAMFTAGVEVLRTVFPNDRIRMLGAVIWDVFHHRHVVMGLGPPVPTLSFAAFGKAGILQAIVFAPHNWAEMVTQDALMQLGAIVMVGSQAVDFYNGRLTADTPEIVGRRARSNEAEYLLALGSAVTLNGYQQSVLRDFPGGFDPSLSYNFKAVAPKN